MPSTVCSRKQGKDGALPAASSWKPSRKVCRLCMFVPAGADHWLSTYWSHGWTKRFEVAVVMAPVSSTPIQGSNVGRLGRSPAGLGGATASFNKMRLCAKRPSTDGMGEVAHINRLILDRLD